LRHIKTRRFAKSFAELPPEVKAQASKAFALFCEDMSHPSLSIERIVGYPGVWSGRVSQKVRWTFHFEQDELTGERVCVHRVIGNHEDVYRNPS
jgi:hypothetical protein